MRDLSFEELNSMSAAQLVQGIADGEFSILRSLGCKKLLRETRFGKLGAKFIVRLSKLKAKGKSRGSQQKALCKILSRIAPYESPALAQDVAPAGLIIAFNHPSLGEILRLIEFCLDNYPERQMLFPVTIAWFEALAPNYAWLQSIGIRITPTVTPKAIEEMLEVNPGLGDMARDIASKLNGFYQSQSHDFIASGDILLVAPTATRNFHLFECKAQERGDVEIKPETLSLIAISLSRDKELQYTLMPLAVVPPEMYSAGLNLFEKYKLLPCERINTCETQSMSKHKIGKAKVRELDLWWRTTIAARFRQAERSELITRPTEWPDVTDPWTDYE